MGAVFFGRKRTTRCSQKRPNDFTGIFLGGTVPGDQNESGLLFSQESRIITAKHRETNEINLLRPGDIECLNFCFTAASLTEGESILHLFKLTRQGPECDGLNCNLGCYKAVSKDCHKLLDEPDMFMLHIEFPIPVKFCLREMYRRK